jgi:glutamate synthase domain-containing protein 2
MDDRSPPVEELANPAAVANYIAVLSAELATIARQFRLEHLQHLLEMVRLEAEILHRPDVD